MKKSSQIKKNNRKARHRRIRAKISGTARQPRFCVFRSNAHIYAQLIDDEKGLTIAAASDLELKARGESAGSQKERAKKVGQLIAKKAEEKKIKEVIFDRAGYKYHGCVLALAEGARAGGLKF